MSKKSHPSKVHTCGIAGEYGQVCDSLITACSDLSTLSKDIETFTIPEGQSTEEERLKLYESLSDMAETAKSIANDIDDAKLYFVSQHEEHADELDSKDREITQLQSMVVDEFHNGSADAQKRELLEDLFNNCSIQELEALEMIIRIRKGKKYTSFRALTHPDHIDINLCFNELKMAVSKKGNEYGTFVIPKEGR